MTLHDPQSLATPTTPTAELNQADLHVEHYYAPGQLVNENARAVRIIHTPTGTTASSESARTGVENTALAMRELTRTLAHQAAGTSPAADPPDHLVVITLDEQELQAAREHDPTIDPEDPETWSTDREFLTTAIRCLADPTDYTRDCVTWWQCDCQFTPTQWDTLTHDGEGPCPESPTGWHRPMGFTQPRRAARPSPDCWAFVSDYADDAIWDLVQRHKLRPGEYPVHVVADEESIEIDLAETRPAQGGEATR